jgi:hypothetical protein
MLSSMAARWLVQAWGRQGAAALSEDGGESFEVFAKSPTQLIYGMYPIAVITLSGITLWRSRLLAVNRLRTIVAGCSS